MFLGVASGQSPYQLKTGRELGLVGGGALMLGVGYATEANQKAVDPTRTSGVAPTGRERI